MADSQRKTANLFDGDVEQGTWNAQITPIVKANSSVRCRVSNFIDVTENTQYTISLVNAISGLQIIVVYVDDNYSRLSESTWLSLPTTFNTPTNCKYVEAIFRKSDNTNIIPSECGNLMLNKGSTPLPYEPYYPHSLRKLTTATEAVENPLYSDGTAITSYTIKGNTVQNGTPSPSNPVEVNGVGVRTENLLDIEAATDSAYINSLGEITYNDAWSVSDYISVESLTTYTISRITDQESTAACHAFYDSNKSLISTIQAEVSTQTFETPTNAKYIRCSWRSATIQQVMLNTGSTAKPHEPYGYKILISNGQQSIDIYIGDLPLLKSLDGTAFDEIGNGTLTRRVDSDGSVLPTPTTTQITMPSIPTADGANSITVDTTVQPSEFTATWTGWHDSEVKEKSENLWDEDYTGISDTIIYKPVYVGDGQFTMSNNAPRTSDLAALLFLLAGNVSSGASSGINGVWDEQPRTVTSIDGYVTVAYRTVRTYTPVGSQTMLNTGSTALPYEPYWK